jgi:hypothetical protein
MELKGLVRPRRFVVAELQQLGRSALESSDEGPILWLNRAHMFNPYEYVEAKPTTLSTSPSAMSSGPPGRTSTRDFPSWLKTMKT